MRNRTRTSARKSDVCTAGTAVPMYDIDHRWRHIPFCPTGLCWDLLAGQQRAPELPQAFAPEKLQHHFRLKTSFCFLNFISLKLRRQKNMLPSPLSQQTIIPFEAIAMKFFEKLFLFSPTPVFSQRPIAKKSRCSLLLCDCPLLKYSKEHAPFNTCTHQRRPAQNLGHRTGSGSG